MSIEVLGARYFDLPACVQVVAFATPAAGAAQNAEILAVPIPASLAGAVPQRILEYRFGRVAAARAIRALGRTEAIPPGRDSAGVPIWEPGIAGSITHTRGFTAAAAALTTGIEAIGIDAEAFVTGERLEAASRVALTDSDRGMLRRFAEKCGPERACHLLLGLVSAKESITKCLGFPLGMEDFREIRLSNLSETDTGRIAADFTLHAGAFATSIFFDSERVYSCCCIEVPQKPSS